MVGHSNLFRRYFYVVGILDMTLIFAHLIKPPHTDINILQQMGHSTLTLTFLEINEDENYKVTLFD